MGSVNCLTRAGGALDGLVFFGEASDHGVARGDFGELRQGEVRRILLLRTPVNRGLLVCLSAATTATAAKRSPRNGRSAEGPSATAPRSPT